MYDSNVVRQLEVYRSSRGLPAWADLAPTLRGKVDVSSVVQVTLAEACRAAVCEGDEPPPLPRRLLAIN